MLMTKSPYVARNGTQITVIESERYFKVSVSGKIWYWSMEDGKFDGTSWDIKE